MESGVQLAPALLKALRRAEDEETRARAGTLILAQGASAVGTLLAALNDPDYDHPFIVELLGRIGDARAAPRLTRLPTRGSDQRLTDACEVALRRLGPEAVVELSAALADPDCDVVWAAKLLGELREVWAIPALAGRLRAEKDPAAFEACLAALTTFGSDAASELGALLVTTTQYPARVVRAAVGVGDPRLAAALCARLCTEADPVTVDLCIAGLRQFERDPIPDLIVSLHAPERDTQVAAIILGKLRDPRAVPALAKAVRIHPK